MVSITGLLIFAALSLFIADSVAPWTHTNQTSSSLSRRRRYLNFPKKAAIVMSCSMLKGIANDVTWFPTTKVVTIHELDILFPLPHEPSSFELGQTALGQPPMGRAARHRRQLYTQLEDLFYLQGFEGRSCILRAMCEAHNLPQTAEENLLHELLSVIFKMPRSIEVGKEYAVLPHHCDRHIKSCPVSVFELASNWANLFSEKYLPAT